MNKSIMILSVGALLFFQLHAEDARDQVRNEILKSLDEVDKARQTAIDEMQKTVKSIEDARAERGEVSQDEKTIGTKIVETQALGAIAQSAAKVEIAKINAKEKTVHAIIKIKDVESGKTTPLKIENEKALAAKKIVKAIASVEIAKAKAARTIIDETKKVELSKIDEQDNLLDNTSALKIAKNISAVKIARSVSAVEISEAVSNVKIAKVLLNEDVALSLKEQYKDLTLDEIKLKAKADISTIAARMEVVRAKSLADIAQIVSFVEIAEAIKVQNKKQESMQSDKKISTYPKEFIIFNVK
jgi:hypothetical protein